MIEEIKGNEEILRCIKHLDMFVCLLSQMNQTGTSWKSIEKFSLSLMINQSMIEMRKWILVIPFYCLRFSHLPVAPIQLVIIDDDLI